MSTFLFSLGRWSFRHPWRVLVAWLLVLGVAGGGALVFMKGTENSFSIPGTEAQEGIEMLGRTFPQTAGTSAQLVAVAPDGDRVDEEPARTIIADAVRAFEALDEVAAVTDPFDDTVSGLVSDDGQAAIVQVQLDGQFTDIGDDTVATMEDIADDVRADMPEGSQVALGGDLFATSVPGLTATEALGVLIALIVLIIVFRSFAIAWFPLVSALVGVGIGIALIYASTAAFTVSSVTPMLAVMLGLAVGIDYALFIVSRHQDQVRAGVPAEESAARATGTAGSAVVFAGVTVLIALVGLSFAGIPFLTTMGIAAAVTVAIAVVVAVTLTPALLGMRGDKVVGWRRRREHASGQAPRRGFADRWVHAVTRRPVLTTLAVVVGLAVVAIPSASLTLALPNAGVQPESSQARQAYDLNAEHFGPGANGPLVMAGTIVTSTDPLQLMADLQTEIEQIDGVKDVVLSTPNPTADTGFIQIIPETAPDDPATADLVRELRAQHDRLLDEYGVDLVVTGFTAVGIDISDRLAGALLPFGIFVVGLSLVLLTIVFRSIWVPLIAAAGYLLSVLAAFGVVAAVFEWGWLADLLHVTRTGPVISFMPIILMGVLFGLAMDYQVFLVTRMREDYVHARGRDRATAIGAIRSGFTASARVVTAAALIMFAVFAAFVPEGDSSIKPIALGLAAGIAVDAFLVRMTLVPAVMALLGEKAWYLPRWLEGMLPHFDVEGEAVERELAHADWPASGADRPLVGERVGVRSDERVLFSGAEFSVPTGGTLLVTSPDPTATRALALTVAGRLAPTDGLLRVAGHLLPGRAAWVRGHVGLALLADAADPVDAVRRAVAGGSRLVVLDGVDTLAPDARDSVAGVLGDRDADTLTLVVTARRDGPALDLLALAGRRGVASLALDASGAASDSATATASTEVTA